MHFLSQQDTKWREARPDLWLGLFVLQLLPQVLFGSHFSLNKTVFVSVEKTFGIYLGLQAPLFSLGRKKIWELVKGRMVSPKITPHQHVYSSQPLTYSIRKTSEQD